ncbi:MAG: hypothetical protein JWP44_2335 [Mucilaginibacter sp.]|nr:hypothetical protein [Mucilaginibacter sp.]
MFVVINTIMIKLSFNDNYRFSIFLTACIFAFVVFSGFQSNPIPAREITLRDEHLPVTPKEFYVAKVVDERDDHNTVAWLLPAAINKNNESKPYPVNLHGGAAAAIKQFTDHNLLADKSARPVVIALKQFIAKESYTAGGSVEGRVSLIMSFNLDRGENEDALHLAGYNGNVVYSRSADKPWDVEPTLRKLLINGLVYINTWINRQAGTNIKLAKAVKVNFTDYEEKPEGDTIYYSVKRPLKWSDFQSKTGNNKYEAEVFPFIGYDEEAKVINGVINVRLIIKVSLPKSACWVKRGSESDYALNHEQRHFDIVKLVAEHFKQKIKAQNLPVSNFEGPINEEYLETYREMDRLQKLYDSETMHGINHPAQQRWNEKIDKELKDYGVR